MKRSDFARWSHAAADWSTRYLEEVSSYPVRAHTRPGDIAAQIANAPPEAAESMESIMADFEAVIPGGMTHWQHPRFFAYFPSNAAPAAIVAEQLAAALSAQCMLWQTSPAATELETCMLGWLRQATGLPDHFDGVLQDTASSATLCAVLTLRERALGWRGNTDGLAGTTPLRVYASEQTHSSIDRALWIAGLGQRNLVKIPVDDTLAMDESALRQAIRNDRAAGLIPAGIILTVGGTSIGASDRVGPICQIARDEDLYTHLDAAWAGSAMICPEFRPLWDGVEHVDSLVFNPHKWLGAPMECSAHFVREPTELLRTLSIRPDYLQTFERDGIVNYSEWSIQLGRRFRALKLWFLFRAYGLDGLRQRIRDHVLWSRSLAERLHAEIDFQITSEPVLSLFSFRHLSDNVADIDEHNRRLLAAINDDGRIYLTPTTVDGQQVIRFQAGYFDMQASDIDIAFEAITEVARSSQI